MTKRLGRIKDHVLGIMGGGVVDQEIAAYDSWLQFYKGFMEGRFIAVGVVGVEEFLRLPNSFML